MNALIIMGANFKVTPYYQIYVDALKMTNVTISIAYWNRTKETENIDPEMTVFPFCKQMDNSVSPLKKLPLFIQFRRFIKHVIKKKNYDLIIVLDTQFAVLIADILLKNKEKYIYDMRDLSYEKYKLYRCVMNHLEKKSAHTFLSSRGYEQFFDDKSLFSIFHNYKKDDVNYNMQIQKEIPKGGQIINVGYWGCLRDVELYKEFVLRFKNDNRFMFHFYGIKDSNMKQLEEFTVENNIKNVLFYGEYEECERYRFAKQTDVILNIYANSFNGTNPIMSNKYYDGVFFGIPQICTRNSYMGEIVDEKNLGINYDSEEKIAEKLFHYITKLDRNEFICNCMRERKKIIEEQEKSMQTLTDTIKIVMQKL